MIIFALLCLVNYLIEILLKTQSAINMDVGLLVSLNVLQRQSQNSPKMSSFMNFVITQRNKIILHF